MVRIRLLGGVSATDGGRPVDVGPAKCQTVLAVLVLAAGSAVPVPRLVDLVWGEEPPRTAEKTLQSYVVRLRRALGAGAIVRVGAAYRLTVHPEALDVARFRQQLALGNIEAALVEWTGIPLAGLEAPGLTPVVDGLVEQWLATVEIDLEHRLQTDPTATIGPLTELTANHPFREGLWSLLMTALYRVGRQADALDAYQKARHHLVEQLGVEPGPRLRELESLILGQDERLRGPERSTALTSPHPTGTVTFGFCEVEDSSRLWAAHPTKMAAAVARLDGLVRAVVDRHGGWIFAAAGETFGASFHRADDAAAWARELQLEASSEPWPGGVELRLRIGLHTGETEERAGSYFGAAVNTAGRIAAAGHGGQILVSGVTSDLLDRREVLDLGTYRLDGEASGVRIVQLDDGRHPPLRTEDSGRGNLPRRLDRIHGRDNDLDSIREALSRSPVVTLVGPGGIGKTRLALAVGMSDDAVAGVWLVELARIASSQTSPVLWPTSWTSRKAPDAAFSSRWWRPCRHGRLCSCWTTANTSSTARRSSSKPLPGDARTCGCSPPLGKRSVSAGNGSSWSDPSTRLGRPWSSSTSAPKPCRRRSMLRPRGLTWSRSAAVSTAYPWLSSWLRPGHERSRPRSWWIGWVTACA